MFTFEQLANKIETFNNKIDNFNFIFGMSITVCSLFLAVSAIISSLMIYQAVKLNQATKKEIAEEAYRVVDKALKRMEIKLDEMIVNYTTKDSMPLNNLPADNSLFEDISDGIETKEDM